MTTTTERALAALVPMVADALLLGAWDTAYVLTLVGDAARLRLPLPREVDRWFLLRTAAQLDAVIQATAAEARKQSATLRLRVPDTLAELASAVVWRDRVLSLVQGVCAWCAYGLRDPDDLPGWPVLVDAVTALDTAMAKVAPADLRRGMESRAEMLPTAAWLHNLEARS